MTGNNIEVWKTIRGSNGAYEISNFGKVRSVARTTLVKNRYGGENYRSLKGNEIKAIDNGNGYLYVSLYTNGKRNNFYIHRLVAEHFCKKNGENDVVNHKDYNKTNNRAENLEWCSQKQNIDHSRERMKHPKKRSKPTNTGQKYISFSKPRGRRQFYRVYINALGVCKRFHTLEQAIAYRDEVIENGR